MTHSVFLIRHYREIFLWILIVHQKCIHKSTHLLTSWHTCILKLMFSFFGFTVRKHTVKSLSCFWQLINGMAGLLSYCTLSLCCYFLLYVIFVLFYLALNYFIMQHFSFLEVREKKGYKQNILTQLGRKYKGKKYVILYIVY